MKNVIERLAMVAMILSLVGVQSSYGQKPVDTSLAGTTPVNFEEVDGALAPIKNQVISRFKQAKEDLRSFALRLKNSNISQDRKNRIRSDVASIGKTLQDIWNSFTGSDLPKAQQIDENIGKQQERVEKLKELIS